MDAALSFTVGCGLALLAARLAPPTDAARFYSVGGCADDEYELVAALKFGAALEHTLAFERALERAAEAKRAARLALQAALQYAGNAVSTEEGGECDTVRLADAMKDEAEGEYEAALNAAESEAYEASVEYAAALRKAAADKLNVALMCARALESLRKMLYLGSAVQSVVEECAAVIKVDAARKYNAAVKYAAEIEGNAEEGEYFDQDEDEEFDSDCDSVDDDELDEVGVKDREIYMETASHAATLLQSFVCAAAG